MAADMYQAGDLASLRLFLSDDPGAHVQADGLLVSLGDRSAGAVNDLQAKRQLLLAAATDLEEQQQRLQLTQVELAWSERRYRRPKLNFAGQPASALLSDTRLPVRE